MLFVGSLFHFNTFVTSKATMCPTIIYKIYLCFIITHLLHLFFTKLGCLIKINKYYFVFILSAWSWCALFTVIVYYFYALLLLWFGVIVQINLFYKKCFVLLNALFHLFCVKKNYIKRRRHTTQHKIYFNIHGNTIGLLYIFHVAFYFIWEVQY